MNIEELQAENAKLLEANITLTDQVETLTGETDSIKSHLDILLTETKVAKDAQRKAEMDSADEEVRLTKIAKEKGDYEQLHKSSEERYRNTLTELESLRGNIANEKRTNAAMRLANELADGHNAELLSTFIENRLVFSDESVKVADSKGQLTVSSLGDLTSEFKNDPKFASLLKGNQSSGGGANGGNTSGGAATIKTRGEFEALNPIQRSEYARSGGTIID
jgi:hypothetical protein